MASIKTNAAAALQPMRVVPSAIPMYLNVDFETPKKFKAVIVIPQFQFYYLVQSLGRTLQTQILTQY